MRLFKTILGIGLIFFMCEAAWGADAKVSALPELSATPETTDTMYIIDDTTSKKITVANLFGGHDIGSDVQAYDAQLADIADGTFTGDFVNTANPWADNEVADDITIDLSTLATTVTISDDESTNDAHEIAFTTNNANLESDGDFTYNPSTGTVTVTALTVESNTVDFGDVTEDYVLTFNASTNTWAGEASGGGGSVDTTGTPANNQVAIWTDADTLEGDVDLTFDGDNLTVDGSVTATSFTADPSATPTLTLEDSDLLGSDEEAAKLFANGTTVTDGAEVTDVTLTYMAAGTPTNAFVVDGSDNQVEFAIATTLQAQDIISADINSYSDSTVLAEPDELTGISDAWMIKYFPAETFPSGVTIDAIHITSSAACTDPLNFEEWAQDGTTSSSTVEAITLSGTFTEDDGTLSDASIAADGRLMVDLDATMDNIAFLEITVIYHAN